VTPERQTNEGRTTNAGSAGASPRASGMIRSAADLRALEAIRVERSEVVYAFVSLEGEPSDLDEALLDDEEQRRSTRFVHQRDRRRFVRAHAGLRLFLARCIGAEPDMVRYETGANGKPRLVPGLPPLEFNLSHSADLGLLAVARDRSVGVDVEHVRDLPDALSIADTHFTAAESKGLRSLPPPERAAAFFRYWTRKEAVIKAGGEGLGRALDSFDVDRAPDSTSAVMRVAGGSGDRTEWLLQDLPSPAGYEAAGAVGARGSADVQWRELSTEVPGGATGH
jgi:4'-phosphopantetheinyl transferase